MTDTTLCICGSKLPFAECCEPIITGARKPLTAEATMRARYTAFARGHIDFLLESQHSKNREKVKRRELEDWSKRSEWLGLEILATDAGLEADEKGSVSFHARYQMGKTVTDHKERAEFEKENGEWRFVDGTPITHAPVLRTAPKVGRNDPCTCGSGKKYKYCHGKLN